MKLAIVRYVERPDLTRMDVLIKQLDEMCRQSQELRERLSNEMARPFWPERRRSLRITSRLHQHEAAVSDAEPGT